MDRIGELVESWDVREEPKMWVWAHEGMWERAWDAQRDAHWAWAVTEAGSPESEARGVEFLAARRLFEAVDRLRDEAYEAR